MRCPVTIFSPWKKPTKSTRVVAAVEQTPLLLSGSREGLFTPPSSGMSKSAAAAAQSALRAVEESMDSLLISPYQQHDDETRRPTVHHYRFVPGDIGAPSDDKIFMDDNDLEDNKYARICDDDAKILKTEVRNGIKVSKIVKLKLLVNYVSKLSYNKLVLKLQVGIYVTDREINIDKLQIL